MSVTLLVNLQTTKIIGLNDISVIYDIDQKLSYILSGIEFMPAHKNGWDGRIHLFNRTYQTFSTGLVPRVEGILKEHCVDYVIQDNRPTFEIVDPVKTNSKLRDDQVRALETCINAKRCLVACATGYGKSYLQVEIACRLNLPTIILVNKLGIMEQFKDWFLERAGIEIGQLGNGVIAPKKITVAMIQTLAAAFNIKNKEFKNDKVDPEKFELIKSTCTSANVFIGDEVHSFVDGAVWKKVHDNFSNAVYRLGFSATPYRRLSTELLLESVFGPIAVTATCNELIAKGILTVPEVYAVMYRQQRLPAGTTYAEAYRSRIAENAERNLLIVKMAVKFWRNGKRVFIAVTHLNHGQLLKEMIETVIGKGKVVFIEGVVKVLERGQYIKDMESGKLRLVIGSKCMNEGVNIKSMDVLISVRSGMSKIEFIQTIGRALRTFPGKEKATIIDIQDTNVKYFTYQAKERMSVLTDDLQFNVKAIDAANLLQEVAYDARSAST